MSDYWKMFLAGCVFYGLLGSWLGPKPCPPLEPAPVPSPDLVEYHVGYSPPATFLVVSATVYYPTGNPTFDGSKVPEGKALTKTRWCALTHDLLRKTGWQYGDSVLVCGKHLPRKHWGIYILRDKTHSRLRNRVDLLVPEGTYSTKYNGTLIRRFTLKTPKV